MVETTGFFAKFFILAPLESRNKDTFLAISEGGMLRVQITLSRPFTIYKHSSVVLFAGCWQDVTVVAANNRVMVGSWLNDNFDLWILAGKVNQILLNVLAIVIV